jgi:hypothetical protein
VVMERESSLSQSVDLLQALNACTFRSLAWAKEMSLAGGKEAVSPCPIVPLWARPSCPRRTQQHEHQNSSPSPDALATGASRLHRRNTL